jgi:hypothetical protein
MARGPQGERRPDDPAAAALVAVQIVTGDVVEKLDGPELVKNPAAVALGRLGGKKGGVARAKKLTSEQKRAIATRAAHVRWERNRTDG